MKNNKQTSFGKLPTRYSFAINQYENEKISKCIICRNNTFKRQFPLLITVKGAPLLSLRVTCKYCSKCEFIIAHKHELEQELCIFFEKIAPDKIGNDYLVIGTMDKKIWKDGLNKNESPVNILDHVANFKKYIDIKIEPARWVLNKNG